jgi:hypothetical protein
MMVPRSVFIPQTNLISPELVGMNSMTTGSLTAALAVQTFQDANERLLYILLAHRSQELNCADAAQNDSRPQKQNLRPYKKAIPSAVVPLEVLNGQHTEKNWKHC